MAVARVHAILAVFSGIVGGTTIKDAECQDCFVDVEEESASLLQTTRDFSTHREEHGWLQGGLHDFLPHWARHGEMAKRLQHKEPASSVSDAEPSYWDAPVDHFAFPSSNLTFRQKYYVNKEHYVSGGPVFFQLGGEGPVKGPPRGYIAALAAEHKALLVQVEHRFYGESVPNGNVDTDNLKLLTVDQALADYAIFIDYYTNVAKLKAGTKWFAFGGSYPGALSAWFRAAYPEKTVGSLSSSGVVNAIFNFWGFDSHIARVMTPTCAEGARRVTKLFENAILARGHKERKAKVLFKASNDLIDGDFFYMLADGMQMMVQYGGKSRLCSTLTDLPRDDDEAMEAVAALITSEWGQDFGSMCFYDTNCLSDPSRYVVGGTDRSWRWQKCYELAYLQAAPLPGQHEDGLPLPPTLRSYLVNLTYAVDQCNQIFGNINVDRGTTAASAARINAKFGGPQPKASRVFYSNFGDDPWLEASVMPPRDVDLNQPYEMANCDDCGHCMDFGTPQDSDPPELKKVRSRFEVYLKHWLDTPV